MQNIPPPPPGFQVETPDLGRPILLKAPPSPAPQTPAQRRKDELDVINTEGQIQERQQTIARGGLPPEKFADLKAQHEAIGGFRRNVDELESLFGQKIEGPDRGGILGMGGDRNVGGHLPALIRPDNKTFNDRSDALINSLAPMLGLTGTELNSLGEIRARFGPLLPSATDSDENIRLKLQGLRKLADDQERAISAQLPQREISGGNREQVEVATGETRFERDPRMAGLNEQVARMVAEGAAPGKVAKFLKEKGASPQAQMDVMRQVHDYRKFKERMEKRGKKVGLPTIDLERREVPNSTWNKISASPAGAALMAAGNTITGNHLDNLAGLTGSDPELANIGMAQVRQNNPGASLAGDLAGGLGLYGAGAKALGTLGVRGIGGGAFSRSALAGDAAMGGYIGSGANGTEGFSAQGALTGAAAGMAGGALGRGTINTIGRTVSPSGGALAPAYAEGVRPTIGQRMGGVVDRAEQAFTSMPLVGGIQRSARNRAIEDWQAGAFNQALREIGTQLPKGVKSGTGAHAFMQDQFNAAYTKARSGMTFRQDPQFIDDFRGIATEVASLSDGAQKRFAVFVRQAENKMKARGGVLNGNDFKTLSSTLDKRIRKIRSSPSGDYELADSLEELSIAMDNAARRHSSPEAVAALDAADRGYVMSVLIENAGRKPGGEIGEFSGKQLESAILGNSGLRSRQALRGEAPLQDYAAAGARLGQSVPDSGTPERLAALGGAGALAHFIDPMMLSPWAANTLMNLPGGRQALNALIAPNRKVLDPARRQILKRAHYGGLLAAPAAQNMAAP